MMKLIAVVILIVFSQFPSEDAFKINPRIANGRNAPERKYPHYAFLHIEAGDEKFGCGGTLLNDKFVLTAAHCIDKVNITAVNIQFGTADIGRPRHVVRVEKDNIFKYPKFVLRRPTVFDIGMCFNAYPYFACSFCSVVKIY